MSYAEAVSVTCLALQGFPVFGVCEHYKDGGVTTSQLCDTITNLIARLWVLTHQTVGVLAAS